MCQVSHKKKNNNNKLNSGVVNYKTHGHNNIDNNININNNANTKILVLIRLK